MADPLAAVNTRDTPQTDRADARQERNPAGGHAFPLDELTRLRRFLVLGVAGGTYYVRAGDLAKDNAGVVLDLARTRTAELVAEIVAVSTAGRAPRQNPALFALAAACALGDVDGRRAALAALPVVARTGTHLFLFARYVEQFRGWGRGLRRAVADWYLSRTVDDVAFQAVKYRQREGWSHRDLLRLAHPRTEDDDRRRLFDWICGRAVPVDGLRAVEGFQRARTAAVADIPALIGDYPLSWEMLPDAALNDRSVWEALLAKGLPQTALLRQLPRLTRLGLFDGGHDAAAVAERLADPDRLRRGRVHPVSVLLALRTYAAGRGARGQAAWTPSPARSLVGSVRGNGTGDRGDGARLRDRRVHVRVRHSWPAAGVGVETAGGQPQAAAGRLYPCRLAADLEIDTFVVYTDNETWAGPTHPHQALERYRQHIGIDAQLVVVGMTASRFTIADPSDRGMLDVAGFDAAVPSVIAGFARGL